MLTRKMVITVIVAVFVSMSGTASGTQYYVDPNGSDDANGLSWDSAFATIQKGIDANNCVVVEVNEGTYYENINFNGVSCTVTSTNPNDWDVVEATIIDGNDSSIAVLISSGEDSSTVLRGLTVRNASNSGVRVSGSSTTPVISNCIIENDGSYGINCLNAVPTVMNNIIRENTTGIHCSVSAAPTIINNWIYNNINGVLALNSGSTVLKNNTIVGHSNYGIMAIVASPTISNCILWDNGDDLYALASATYSCIEDVNDANGIGNITSDPLFVDADTNDFHLAVDSPCINAGDPNGDYTGQTDIDGDQRVINGRVDMGADEALSVFNLDSNKWYDTIQAAINDSNNGDEIVARAKTYYENVNFGGKSVTLRSTDPNDWDIVAATIIDANDPNTADGIMFDSGEDANSILKGFTVRNGYAGVYVDDGWPVISKCILQGNSVGVKYTKNSTGTLITNSKIYNNSGYGVYGHKGDAIIKNNWVYDNGIGVKLVSASADIYNNTIMNNDANGVEKGGGQGQVTINNCIIWNNGDELSGCSATYSCIKDINDANGTGNISSNPCFVDPNNHDYHIVLLSSPCINAGDPNGDYEGQIDIDGQGRVYDNRVDMGADECPWYSLFGMEVNSVTKDANGVVAVVTTGATYVLSSSGMDMYRRVDPNTNNVDNSNGGRGRKVAELTFEPNIGYLSIDFNDVYRAIVQTDKARFDFYSDSLFFVTAKADFNSTHTNLITDAPWNAPLEPNDRDLDRMWTDGYGGSLHAKISGDPNATVDVNYTAISMSEGDVTAHMVFPPKTFDFNSLYETNARPFVHFLNVYTMQNVDQNEMTLHKNDGFGVYLLWCNIYDKDPNGLYSEPVLLGSDPDILGYKIEDPCSIRDFINLAHAPQNDFKVITYLSWPANPDRWSYPNDHPKEGDLQDIAVTLNWMRSFQEEYDFDGWYFDNADAGDLIDDYDFIRQVRTDIGCDGIIYHHDSVDVWSMNMGDWYTGLRAIFIDAYVNYTLTGETGTIAEVDYPNDPYFRFFTSGYGMSQAYGSHIRLNVRKLAISEEETHRTLGENLNSCAEGSYSLSSVWSSHFKPAYDIRKTEYAGGGFDPDVNWPLDPNTNWFRTPTDINVTDVNSNSATITWTTNSVADSNVAYTSNGVWWPCDIPGLPDGPDGAVSDSNMVTSHTITLTGLDANTPYEFKIRSTNDTNDPPSIPGEIIWGYVGTFETNPQ